MLLLLLVLLRLLLQLLLKPLNVSLLFLKLLLLLLQLPLNAPHDLDDRVFASVPNRLRWGQRPCHPVKGSLGRCRHILVV